MRLRQPLPYAEHLPQLGVPKGVGGEERNDEWSQILHIFLNQFKFFYEMHLITCGSK